MLLQQLYMFVGLRLIALSFGHAMFYLKRWPDWHSEIFHPPSQPCCGRISQSILSLGSHRGDPYARDGLIPPAGLLSPRVRE